MGFFSSLAPDPPKPPTQVNPSASSTDVIREPQPLPSSLEKDVYTRTGYDPSSTWRSLISIFSGRMNEHGQYLFVEDKFARKEQEDCLRCQKDRDYLLQYSPIIRFMNEKISDLGGENIAGKIRCERCVTRVVDVEDPKAEGGLRKEYWRKGGGFSPDHGILVCANEVRDRKHLEDVMAHEMVHAWDHLRWKVDWMDLRHSACTEIRASMLSGECRWTREFFKRNHWTITQQFQSCVKTRATKSVAARPFCKDDVQAAKAVNEVWESCFNDTRPFDEVYK